MFSGLSTTLLRCRKRRSGLELTGEEPLLGCDHGAFDKKPTCEKKRRPDKQTISTTATELKAPSDPDCPICFERVGKRNLDGYLEKWAYLPCGHRFGSACLAQWILEDGNEHHRCPTCRRNYHCRCGHLWLPCTSLGKADRKRFARYDPEMPVPDVCDFCDMRFLKIVARMWDDATRDVLRRRELWEFDEDIPKPPRVPTFPECETHFDVLWKTWYKVKLEQLKGLRRPPRRR